MGYPYTRTPLDAKTPLFARRTFLWDQVSYQPGDAFPAGAAPLHRLAQLWEQHFVDHESPAAMPAEAQPADEGDDEASDEESTAPGGPASPPQAGRHKHPKRR